MERNLVDVTGNKNLIQGEKKLERSHFRVQVSSQEFCFILLFSFLSDYPFRLFVSELLSCSCKYKGEKGGSLRKVFCGVTVGERVGRNLRRKFHRSYLNFCSSLPRRVGTWKISPGQFSPNVQILSNFLRIAFRDNFTFQTFSTSLFLRSLLIFHCPTDKGLNTAPSSTFLHSFLSSNFRFGVVLHNFQMLFLRTPHDAQPVRQVGGKGCRNDCNSFQLEYHVPSGCRGNSLLFVTNTGDKIVQGWRLRWKYHSIVILRFFVKLTPSPPPLHICVQNIAKFIIYIERIMIVNGNSNYDRWLVRCCVSLHT